MMILYHIGFAALHVLWIYRRFQPAICWKLPQIKILSPQNWSKPVYQLLSNISIVFFGVTVR